MSRTHYNKYPLACFGVGLLVVSGSSCSGPSTRSFYEDTTPPPPDQVIARIDNLGSRPDWLHESTPFIVNSDEVISLGVTEIPADHRVDAAYRIAENNAEAAIAGAIGKRLEFIFQNAEEGTGVGDTQARYIGAETTRLVASSLRPGQRYWEKILTTTETGRRLIKYRVFATVEMPADEFHRAMVDAIRRASGQGGLSADFAEKVNRQWDSFVNGEPVPPTAAPPATAPVSSEAR